MKHIVLLALLLAAAPVLAQEHSHEHNAQEHQAEHADHHDGMAADTSAVIGVAERFLAAIIEGNREALEALVLPDALILESGGIETRSEYLSHHFGSDGAFLKAMTREPKHRKINIVDKAAWVASTSRLHGHYRDRDVDVSSAELLVLRWVDGAWRVASVHWSSR